MKQILTEHNAGMLDLIAGKISQANADNGWHDRYLELVAANDTESIVEHVISKVALVGSELSEAIEELRDGFAPGYVYYHAVTADGTTVQIPPEAADDPEYLREMNVVSALKPEGFPVELADACIRLLDLMGMLGLQAGTRVREKLAYNSTRGERHGGKTI